MPPMPAKPQDAGSALLFLREEQLRLAQDMLFLAWRDLAASADAPLEQAGLGRAHHRALHFIARSPGITVSGLLAVLGITKQSLARVLTVLQARGLVSLQTGRADRRQRLLRLTQAGEALERAVFECQRERLLAAYRAAGGPAVEGFRQVLAGLIGRDGQAWLDRAARLPAAGRAPPGTAQKPG